MFEVEEVLINNIIHFYEVMFLFYFIALELFQLKKFCVKHTIEIVE